MFYICRMKMKYCRHPSTCVNSPDGKTCGLSSRYGCQYSGGLKEVYVAKRIEITPLKIDGMDYITKIDVDLQDKLDKAIGNIIEAKYQVVLEVVKMLVKPKQPTKEDYKRVTLLVFEHYTIMEFDGVRIGKITETKNDEGLVNGWLFEPLDNSKTPD